MMKNGKKLSLIICTYNRVNLLEQLLNNLASQYKESYGIEIIIIDNGSTDTTLELLEDFQKKNHEMNLIYITESNIGSGYARISGARIAKGHWIGFLDDDANVQSNFLNMIHNKILSFKQEPHAFGGQIIPFYVSGKPVWFKDSYEIRTWGKFPRKLDRNEAFSGSNMFFQKSVFLKICNKSVDGGMKNDLMFFGEDTVLFEELWKIYQDETQIHYFPDIIVLHAVTENKMQVNYILKRQFKIGQSNYYRQVPPSFLSRFWLFFKNFGVLLKLIFKSIIKITSYSHLENWIVEQIGPVCKKLGFVIASMGCNFKIKQR